MSGFEKYFVFGNSYDLTGGKGVKLGQMGIGGKLANDKLFTKQIYIGLLKQKTSTESVSWLNINLLELSF